MITGLEEYLPKVKIIISEVDGVLTDGAIPIDELGNVSHKYFYHKDFEAINLIKKHFKIVFLSADNRISYHFFRRKSIPFYYADKVSKKSILVEALRRYSLAPEEALYIGCTHSDVECMQIIPFSICTNDAVGDAKNLSVTVLDAFGGLGVFSEVYDMLKPEILRRLKADA